MARFANKAIAYIGSSFLDSVLQIFLGMLLVRYLTKFEYGTFRQIMLLSVVVSSSLAIALPQSLSYFIPIMPKSSDKKQLAFQAFFGLTLLGLCAAALSYIFRDNISHAFNNSELVEYAWIFSLFFLFVIPSKCTQPLLISLGRIKFASFLNAATAISNFLCIVTPLLLGKPLKYIFVSMLFVYILKFFVVTFILLKLDGRLWRLIDKTLLKSQIVYSIPLWGSLITGILRKYIDQFLIAFLFNPVNFAIYSRGAFELPFVAVLPHNLSALMIPKIAQYHKQGSNSRIIYLWQESMWKVALVFFPLFIYAFIFAEEIITLLFTSSYIDSVIIFRIYLVLLPFRVVSYRTILMAIGKTRPIFTAVLISLGICGVLGIILERVVGLPGPAIAMIVGELAASFYMLLETLKTTTLHFTDLVPLKKLFYLFLCSASIAGLVAPLKYSYGSSGMKIFVTGTLYFSVYLLIVTMLNFVTERDWQLFGHWATFGFLKTKKNARGRSI